MLVFGISRVKSVILGVCVLVDFVGVCPNGMQAVVNC